MNPKSSEILRAGMPKLEDIAAHLRLHADKIANSEVPRPRYAIVIEFFDSDEPDVHTFGVAVDSPREAITVLVDASMVLGDAIQAVNAEASH